MKIWDSVYTYCLATPQFGAISPKKSSIFFREVRLVLEMVEHYKTQLGEEGGGGKTFYDRWLLIKVVYKSE